MASWSTKRKYGYFFGLIFMVVLLGGVPAFFLFYKAPTCSDGKQNGGERGVDCGGKCARLCPADFTSTRVLWSHSMKILPGIYNSLTYIQNPNQAVEIKSLDYSIKLYDIEGILIAERKGSTFVPAGQKFVVFQGGIKTGERTPVKTTFEFTAEPLWRPGNVLSKLRVLNSELEQSNSPKVEVKIQNDAVDQSFSNIDAYVILYDKDDNRVAFSKTVIEQIGATEVQSLYFTWPEAFVRPIVRTEVVFMARPRN
ncbi:MAG: hypothetical protein RLZZ67_125 [Candidatus Parcubacteria bacterium]|jgi:hypothetical protein